MTLAARLMAPAAIAALSLTLGHPVFAQDAPSLFVPEGTWSGLSKCTEQAAICEDEQIVIRVTKDPKPMLYDVDFAVVSNGEEMPDNHLVMLFSNDKHVLTARYNDEHKRLNFYALAVKGDNMAGVLLVNDRIIERTLNLKRTSMTAAPPAAPSSSASSSSASSQ